MTLLAYEAVYGSTVGTGLRVSMSIGTHYFQNGLLFQATRQRHLTPGTDSLTCRTAVELYRRGLYSRSLSLCLKKFHESRGVKRSEVEDLGQTRKQHNLDWASTKSMPTSSCMQCKGYQIAQVYTMIFICSIDFITLSGACYFFTAF